MLVLCDRLRRMLPDAMSGEGLERIEYGPLSHLSLLFVPTGVGVIRNLQVLGEHGVTLAAVLNHAPHMPQYLWVPYRRGCR